MPPISTIDEAPKSLPRFLIAGAGILAALAVVAWLTRADVLFLELAGAALAMCF